MPSTTLDLVQSAFRTAIEGMTPRYTSSSSTTPWKFYEGEQPVRSDARWFRFDWDGTRYVEGGFMGPLSVDTEVVMTLTTDYGGIPEATVKRLAHDDHYQIRDVLNRLKATVDGFRWLEAIDWDFDPRSTDRNQARVRHQYLVRYMKARA